VIKPIWRIMLARSLTHLASSSPVFSRSVTNM